MKVVIRVIALLVAALGLLVFFNLPKPLAVQDTAYDLSPLANGICAGRCDNDATHQLVLRQRLFHQWLHLPGILGTPAHTAHTGSLFRPCPSLLPKEHESLL